MVATVIKKHKGKFVNEKKKMSKNNKHKQSLCHWLFTILSSFLPKAVEVDKRCVVPQWMQTLLYVRQ